jgi:hypothetical protein
MEQRTHVLIAAGGCVAVVLAVVLYLRNGSATDAVPIVKVSGVDSESLRSGDVATFKLDTADVGVRADTRSAPPEAPTAEMQVGDGRLAADSLTKMDPTFVDMVHRVRRLDELLKEKDRSDPTLVDLAKTVRGLDGLMKDQDRSMHELGTEGQLHESIKKGLEALEKQQQAEGSPR